MDILEHIYKRRSIRKYQNRKLDQETIKQLLKAAMAAPSAANSQTWEFIVVTDENILDKLRQLRYANHNAPAVIAVCGNLHRAFEGPGREFWVQDCSAATENILLAAPGLGLGAVWVGVYPEPDKTEAARKILGAPEHIIPLNLIYTGYPAEEREPRTQYDEGRIHWNQYCGE